MPILLKEQIIASEKAAVENGLPYREMMHAAGCKAAEIIADFFSVKSKHICVLCGTGNNGGDGFVVADELKKAGADVCVVLPLGTPKTENASYYFSRLEPGIISDFGTALTKQWDMVVDALFGIGFRPDPDGSFTELFEQINNIPAIKAAIDIPSGMEADTANGYEHCVRADLTVTFLAYKACFLAKKAANCCGRIRLADIGVPPVGQYMPATENPVFLPRPADSHKGTFGTVTTVCGSYGMAGAVVLSAKAAYRTGAGLVRSVVPKSIYPIVSAALPEAVFVPCGNSEDTVPDIDWRVLYPFLEQSSALLVGCGLSHSDSLTQLIRRIVQLSPVPLVVDADGINALSGRIDMIKECKVPLILTPHPKEMSRLTGLPVEEIENNRVDVAKKFAQRFHCILVLKGCRTLIAEPDGTVTVNFTGNPGMATAGSGDVLSGMIVSLLAQGYSAADAAKKGVYLHGAAGDAARKKRCERAVIASDLIEEL